MQDVQDVISNVLNMYSYYVSDDCTAAIADAVTEYFNGPPQKIIVTDRIAETDDKVLVHIHAEGEEGHRYWLYKEPLDMRFISDGVEES